MQYELFIILKCSKKVLYFLMRKKEASFIILLFILQGCFETGIKAPVIVKFE